MQHPVHHPLDAVLIDYASGSLPEAQALVVATHAALCPACRSQVLSYESVGGALLEEVEPEAVSTDCFTTLMARLEDGEPDHPEAAATVRPNVTAGIDLTLPEPLRGYVGKSLAELSWRRVVAGVEEAEVPLASRNRSARARLLRIRPGTVLPRHSHRGSELTLVLAGGFKDGDVQYARGDFSWSGAEIDHQPIVDPGESCICLTVTDAPLRLTGRWGRLLNPFLRW